MYAAIVPLSAAHRACITDHLLRLSPEDRSLRFAAGVVSDAAIERYVASIAFERQHALGLVSKRGRVFGFAHGCPYDTVEGRFVDAAFSVDAEWRSRGLGHRLLDAMLQRAAADGGATVICHCEARNRPMRRVFERGGLVLTRDEDGFDARRHVPAMPPPAAHPGLSARV